MADRKYPICFIAHKGYSGKYQQNSEDAYLGAVEHGSGGIETDVHFTKDGVLIVNHDDVVHYADGTTLVIADHTYEELMVKPVVNEKSDKEIYLCTFQRYLEICRDGNMICFIEFKGHFTDEMINKAFTLAQEIYNLSMCEVQSFDYDNLVRSHKMFPDLRIMFTCRHHDENVDRCLEDGFDIDMDFEGITDETIDMFHAKGLKVGVWTVNNKKDLEYCLTKDVDFIESDYFSSADAT